MSRAGLAYLLLSFATTTFAAQPEDEVFSGPQVGEPLPPLIAIGAYDERAGQEVQVVSEAEKNPLLLVFVHELTRPSVAVVRELMNYAATRRDDKLQSAVIFLADDRTEMINRLRRARHAMPRDSAILVSKEGLEGPGSYGLNRHVGLTVLVAKDQKVTANFALVQPSVQADVPKILKAVIQQIGGELPELKVPANRRAPDRSSSK